MKLLLITQYFWPESFSINEVAKTPGKPNYTEGKLFPGYGPLSVDRIDYRGVRIRRLPVQCAVGSALFVVLAANLQFCF